MLEAANPAIKYDGFGRFQDRAKEREFQIASWPEDRRALMTVAIAAALIYSFGVFLDITGLGTGSPAFFMALGIRFAVIFAACSFAYSLFHQKEYAPFGIAGLSQELLIIGGYLLIANMMPDLVYMQTAAMAVMLVFIWFFVPIHPLYGLASSFLVLCGANILHLRYAADDLTSLTLSNLLYFGVLAMGFLSAKNRDRLRRRMFLNQRTLEAANRELRKEIEIREVAESLEAQAKEKFEGLFRASPMPLVLSDNSSGHIVAVNDAFEILVGLPREKIIDRIHTEFVDIDDAYEELDRILSEKPGTVSGDLQIKRADGTIRECTITSVRFDRGADGADQILTGLYDITDRKEFERDLVAARLEAERAQKTQSEFLATMSHEIRTPLNAMLGFLQVTELENISNTARSNLSLARQSGEHLLRLITDILDLSRLVSGKIEFEPVDVCCSTLGAETIETFGAIAKEKGISLKTDIDLSRSHYQFDELRVRQILFNLLGNAVKFTRKGEVLLRIVEAPKTPTDQPWLRVEVVDTGIGVDPSKADYIFQEFTQADNSVTREFGGTGLGLAISKKLVSAMGGRIGVSENSPSGSIFWFEIPVYKTSTNTADVVRADELGVPSFSANQPGRVLVAEDNPMNQRVIGAFLSNLGIDYVIAEDGQAAIEKLGETDFALVLMDIQMPVLDGMSAIRFIRSGATPRHDIPIVVLTANAMAGDRDSYIAAGADDYLAKPITLDDLRKVLHRFALVRSDGKRSSVAG